MYVYMNVSQYQMNCLLFATESLASVVGVLTTIMHLHASYIRAFGFAEFDTKRAFIKKLYKHSNYILLYNIDTLYCIWIDRLLSLRLI